MHDAPLFTAHADPQPDARPLPRPASTPAMSKPAMSKPAEADVKPSPPASPRRDVTAACTKPAPAARSVEAVSEDALLVNERDAARILAISERKLWELRMQGLIPHLRIGRAVRYDPEDLKSWINEQKRATAG